MAGIRGEALRYVARRRAVSAITESTATQQRGVLLGFADCMGARDITLVGRSDIERWMGTQQHLAPGTLRNRYSVVHGFFAALVAEGKLRRSPFATLRAPKVPRSRHRALAGGDVGRLLAACPDARARCIVTLGVQLGLRRAEIAGLEVGDIDWAAKLVEVTGKGGHVRVVPLTAAAERAIGSYLAESPANGGPLIRGDRYPTRSVSAPWVGRLITRVAYEAGIKTAPRDGVSTHALRHTAATDIYAHTADVLAVRDVLGHADLSATATYVRGLSAERLRDAMEGREYPEAA